MAGQGRPWEPCPAVLADGFTPCGNKRRPASEFCDRHLAEAEAFTAVIATDGLSDRSLEVLSDDEGPALAVATSQVRGRLADDLAGSYALIEQTLRGAMGSTKGVRMKCPECNKPIQVAAPDHATRLKAVESWFELGYGRPAVAPTRETESVLGAETTLAELEALTMDQLAAYVWVTESADERARRRRLIDEVAAEEWPAGFAEALERLERLAGA